MLTMIALWVKEHPLVAVFDYRWSVMAYIIHLVEGRIHLHI